jgi:hypothetical protein
MLLFVWQLIVMFTSPFIAAQEIDTDFSNRIDLTELIEQVEEGTTITDGSDNVFVEEVLEEEVHPSETLQLVYHPEYIFHFTFHKFSDYYALIQTHFLPPEVMI